MGAKVRPTLAEFAASRQVKGGQACLTCGLPQRDQLDAGYREGITVAVIQDYIRTALNQPISKTAIRNHLKEHAGA